MQDASKAQSRAKQRKYQTQPGPGDATRCADGSPKRRRRKREPPPQSPSNSAAHAAVARIEKEARGLLDASLPLDLTPRDFVSGLRRLGSVLAVDPRLVAKKETQLVGELGRIMLGRSHVRPPPHDPRFRGAAWKTSGYYRRVLQSYLIWRKTLFDILASSRADPADKARARFLLMQLTQALAPTNTPLGNPAFLDRAIKTRGRSLVDGARNFWQDLRHNHQMPRQVDKRAFRVGRDLAITPGAVIHRNEVCEVLQYTPSTAKLHARPLLLVPPQINKYYLVDLAPDKSLVKYAVDQGVPTFLISWRNPTARHAHWNLDTYVGAVLDAIDVVREVADVDALDLVGACAGGLTALAATGYLHATGEGHKVHSQTLLVTAIDTAEPMLLTLFATPATLRAARRYGQRRGVVEGADLARLFSWLRPIDMIWLFFVNNYLLGRRPPSSDMLFWNADSTRLPAGFQRDTLDVYQCNPLMYRRGMKVLGRRIHPQNIRCPSFVVASVKDHLVPWRSAYAATQVLGGETRFLLGDAGHVQTVVSPPRRRAARFFVNGDDAADPDAWLDKASARQGSWWPYWLAWATAGAEPRRPAPSGLGSKRYPAGDPAPGRYVFT